MRIEVETSNLEKRKAKVKKGGGFNIYKLTAKQALEEIQMLKYTFIGDRQQLHEKIDEIINKAK